MVVFLASFVSIGYLPAKENEGRLTINVVGGETAPEGEYPWMVAFLDADVSDSNRDRFFCAGFLVDPYWVLTAAHCIHDRPPSEFVVAYGSQDLNQVIDTIDPVFVLSHPAFYPRTGRGADLALVRLAEPITDVKPLRLNFDSDYASNLSESRIVGWGGTEFDPLSPSVPNQLHVADLTLYSKNYANQLGLFDGYYEPDYLVAGNETPLRGAYAGDSGGPLLIEDAQGSWIAAGITSFGLSGCGGPSEHISLFTDISLFEEWIRRIVFEAPFEPPDEFFANESPNEFFIAENPDSGEKSFFTKIWPFSNRYRGEFLYGKRQSAFSDELRWDEIDHGDLEENLSHRDGYWYFRMPQELVSNNKYRQLFLRQSYERKSSGNDVLIGFIGPFGSVWTGDIEYDSPVSTIKGFFCFLESLQLGKEYRFPRASVLSWKTSGFSNVVEHYESFIAEADRVYALGVMGDDVQLRERRWFIHSGSPKPIGPSLLVSGQLSEDSYQHRKRGYHYDSLELEGSFNDSEVMITVESEFDAEISIHDRSRGEQLVHQDLEDASSAETLIVDNYTAQGSIRIFNFDADIYGAYTIKIEPHISFYTARYQTMSHRAVTRSDEYLRDSEGEGHYYELIKLQFLPTDRDVAIRLRGLNRVKFAMSLYERGASGDRIGSAFIEPCEDSAQIRFRPEPDQLYELIVSIFDTDDLNGNYELIIADDSSPLLNSLSQSLNNKNTGYREVVYSRGIDQLAMEAVMLEARLREIAKEDGGL